MRKRALKKGLVIGIIVLFFGASVVTGVNIEIKKDNDLKNIENLNRDTLTFNPKDDAFIRHYVPGEPANGPILQVKNEYGSGGSTGWGSDSLIWFDISSIPSDTEIQFATLHLYYYFWGDNNPTGRPVNLYRITSDWEEETVTWNTQPSYAPQLTTFANVPSSYGWMGWDVTSDIQDFIDDNEVNYGWKLTDETYWGNYDIPCTAWRSKDYEGAEIPYLEVHINEAPASPTIIGPASGTAGESYEYTFIAFDPEDEDIYYYVDWGDETNTGWLGPYESGEQIILSYTWTSQGTYEIKAKAKDIHDAESDWATLEVTMPVNQEPTGLFNWVFLRGLVFNPREDGSRRI